MFYEKPEIEVIKMEQDEIMTLSFSSETEGGTGGPDFGDFNG